MVHGYYNPLANPLRATTPGSLQHYPNANSPLVRPQATPLTSPMLGAQPVPPLSVGASIVPSSASVAAWMNTTSLLLAPVSLVPLAQRFAPHLTTMSISNARIVATSEAVGDDIFPIGATEEDIEAYRTIKEIQARQRRISRPTAPSKKFKKSTHESCARRQKRKQLPPKLLLRKKKLQLPQQLQQRQPKVVAEVPLPPVPVLVQHPQQASQAI
ncbi:Hypothetical protein, putative [Bodo saltans]|uniref:Uncharacterized protein n=1 Tax=Bodo saltans TaxID=75058 RepID=A0A0S4JFQ7_BODSA|nr:Hypothetical protein, putative [Bodo saltans]|eukprot:CUG89000.1 Hypothetical protein, putative [Bodo saltans]